MSATLVKHRRAHQTFVDNLESFFYVMLWLALMYLSNSMSPPNLTSFVQLVLDPVEYQGTGGNSKAIFLVGRTDLWDLSFPRQPLLQPLLNELAILFAVRYETKPSNEEYEALAELKQTGAWSASFLWAWKHQEHLPVLKSQAHTHVTQLCSNICGLLTIAPSRSC